MSNDELPQRKPTRLKDFDYSTPGAYFVTICAANKHHLFGTVSGDSVLLTPLGRVVVEVWESIPDHFPTVQTDEYVVMPNHLHGIVLAIDDSQLATFGSQQYPSLPTVVRSVKSAVTKRTRDLGLLSGELWQRGYHDHIIRSEKELAAIREYIALNPLRWSLDEYWS